MKKMTWLKIIGVMLFIWVLAQIDREELLRHIINADWVLLISSFFIQYFIYAAKATRWHFLVRSTGVPTSLSQSWRMFNIGIWLANITPGKLGELGKSGYLIIAGLPKVQAISLVIMDRLFDTAVILLIAIVSVGLLFGWPWSLALLALASLTLPLLSWLLFTSVKLRQLLETVGLQNLLPTLRTCNMALLATFVGWLIYFVWAVLLARSVGIEVPAHILIAVFTLTGILSLMPIAPTGLGTRDLALLTLLAPYGVDSSKTVALSMLMLVSILLSCSLGGWYALRDTWVKKPGLYRR